MKVSVVVTSYNQQAYLIDAIESLLNQTVLPYEIIICDDYSTDDSRKYIKEYASRYPGLVKPIFQECNIGATKNRNSGLRMASGDFITTLDGDDRYFPEKIEQELQIATETKALIVYSNICRIDVNGNRIGVRYHPRRQLDGCLFEPVATMRYPAPREMLMARECLTEIGFLDESFFIYEDWDLAIRLASQFKFATCRAVLVERKIHASGMHTVERSFHLETTIRMVQNAMAMCNSSIVEDKDSARRNIESFLMFLQGMQAALDGDNSIGRSLAYASIMKDKSRSIPYDLLLRLWLPMLSIRGMRQKDSLNIGPLALPYYFLRSIWRR